MVVASQAGNVRVGEQDVKFEDFGPRLSRWLRTVMVITFRILHVDIHLLAITPTYSQLMDIIADGTTKHQQSF